MIFANRFVLVVFVSAVVLACSAEDANDKEVVLRKGAEFIGRMLEQGRTMVHHAVKRFMIILPAIFFKLGVAFTMLLLVTVAVVNNGVIGFLLLVVGLAGVLSRLQTPSGASRPAVVPYYLPSPHHAAYHHDWDRRDREAEERTEKANTPAYAYVYTPVSSYNPAYYAQTKS